jgi:phage host-nuclease inhibitor protein Gam
MVVTSSTKTKSKAAALDVPQTIDEANALLAEYGELFNQAAHIEADMNAELAAAKAAAELEAAPVQLRMQQIFDALNAYAGAHRAVLTKDGKTKTVDLPAGKIGWRFNPPSVRWARGYNAEKIVEGIKAAISKLLLGDADDRRKAEKISGFIRTKEEPNKETIGGNPDLAREIAGIRIGSSGEQFYIAPFGAELSEVAR